MNLFILGRDEQAARVAEEFPDHRSNLYVRFLIALGQKQGRDAAHQIAKRLTAPGIPASYGMDGAPMLFLAGTAEDFTALAGGLRADDRDPRFSAIAAEDGMSRLRYLEGALSETELLSRPAPTEMERARRQYVIAWKRLASGDRPSSEAAFRAVYDRMSATGAWWVARGVVIRMKNDPTWPKWTAEKKHE